MEINWFWLAVICAIAGLTITTCVSVYFNYKTTRYRIDKNGSSGNKLWKATEDDI